MTYRAQEEPAWREFAERYGEADEAGRARMWNELAPDQQASFQVVLESMQTVPAPKRHWFIAVLVLGLVGQGILAAALLSLRPDIDPETAAMARALREAAKPKITLYTFIQDGDTSLASPKTHRAAYSKTSDAASISSMAPRSYRPCDRT